MNYELAKKLKELGFFQNTEKQFGKDMPTEGANIIEPNGKITQICWDYHCYGDFDKYWCYVPTLSELIEACGNGFKLLEKSEKGFYCTYWNEKYEIEIMTDYCKTPEEAVANLWLELNRK